jgi:hypothetical protein
VIAGGERFCALQAGGSARKIYEDWVLGARVPDLRELQDRAGKKLPATLP